MDLQSLLRDAPQSVQNEFMHRKHGKGSLILSPHEENNFLYILVGGSAEVYRQSYAGAMISLHVYHPVSCFGEVEIFSKDSKALGIVARTECETIALHKTAVEQWMRMDFNFTRYLLEQLAAKLIASSDTAAKLALLTLKDRILSTVLAHHRLGDLSCLTKQSLAQEVCAPARSVNRSLAECIREGTIGYEGKKFTVRSAEKLERCVDEIL